MEIITGTTDFYLKEETAVAIGKFDGVHVGHRRLLQEILSQKPKGKRACVFSFDPNPSVFFNHTTEMELSTREEKRDLFEQMGIDILIEFPMNEVTASMEPRRFVQEILCNRMNTRFLAAGRDLSFGARGMGNASLLQNMAAECYMEVCIIDKITLDGREVSSTLVREAVQAGEMSYAQKLLGVPYMVSGIVQHGNHIGRTLGMPTVNLILPEHKLLPPCGVYYSGVLMDGVYYKGISNIGFRPTVLENKKKLGVETYLYDYNGDAYGEEIKVFLYDFKRPEQRFENMEALKKQMQEDIEAGEVYSL